MGFSQCSMGTWTLWDGLLLGDRDNGIIDDLAHDDDEVWSFDLPGGVYMDKVGSRKKGLTDHTQRSSKRILGCGSCCRKFFAQGDQGNSNFDAEEFRPDLRPS